MSDLSEVIAAQLNGEEAVPAEVKEEEKVDTPTEAPAEVKGEKKEEPQVDEETAKAVALFKALQNPETAGDVAKKLAEGLGFKLQEVETKKEAAEVVDEIEKAILDDLSEDYPELAAKLSKAIKKAVDLGVANGVKDLREAENTRETERVKAQVNNDFETYHKGLNEIEKKEFDALVPKMTELGKKIPVGDLSPGEYLDVLFAAAKRTLKSGVKNTAPIEAEVVPAKRLAPAVDEGDIDEVMRSVINEELEKQRKGKG